MKVMVAPFQMMSRVARLQVDEDVETLDDA
jgi:hypothetical protein